MPADVFFLAGEASGDFLAAALLRALRELMPAIRCAAVGGEKLKTAGAQLVIDSSEWGSIGPISAIAALPSLYISWRRLAAFIEMNPPRLLIAVDFGAFNLRLLRRLRSRGYHGDILYYFPPGAWLDDSDQARAVANASLPIAPFVHQRDFYARLGLRVEYFGHPLVSLVPSRNTRQVHADAPRIVVAPGSRREEVARHLPVLAAASRALEVSANATFTIAAASQRRADQIRAGWSRLGGAAGAEIVQTPLARTFSAADIAWSASGTAVLEAALACVPQIAFYVLSAAQYRVAQRRLPESVKRTITLPNLVLGRRAVPELVQKDFTPQRLFDETRALLDDKTQRAAQLAACAELRAALGPPDALERIAQFVAERLGRAGGA